MTLNDILSSPTWQGIGVIVTIILGLLGFYYAGNRNKIWLYISGSVVIFIFGFSLGSYSNSQGLQENQTIVAVDAQKDWQSTGIFLRRGDQVSIQVVGGKWTAWRFALPNEDREGFVATSKGAEIYVNGFFESSGSGGRTICDSTDCPLPQTNYGLLIGRIGTSAPFSVGERNTITAAADGILALRINDGNETVHISDNFGVLAVEILRQN